jgi:HNH endonuclease
VGRPGRRRVDSISAAGLAALVARPAHELGSRTIDRDGYVRVKVGEHPLAVRGWVREHILVVYEAKGAGVHPCGYGCGRMVEWGVDLEVDHRDRNRQNNDPANLLVCCRTCNNRNRDLGVRKKLGKPPSAACCTSRRLPEGLKWGRKRKWGRGA